MIHACAQHSADFVSGIAGAWAISTGNTTRPVSLRNLVSDMTIACLIVMSNDQRLLPRSPIIKCVSVASP